MPVHWLVFGFFAVVISFGLFEYFNSRFSRVESKVIVKKLFKISLATNVFTVLLLYLLFRLYNGTEFEPEAADSLNYDEHGKVLSEMFRNGDFDIKKYLYDSDYSDYGYNVFLGIIYSIFGPYALVGRLANALIGALMVVTLYRATELLTDKNTAKTSALLLTFAPFSLFYVSVNMKEILMIYILLQATYYLIKITKVSLSNKLDSVLLGFYTILLFFFRTPLAMAFILSMFVYIYLGLQNKTSLYKLISVLSFIVSFAVILVFISKLGLSSQISEIIDQSSGQYDAELNEKMKSGGRFGLSLDKAAIIPVIFISVLAAPFTTFTLVDNQDLIAWLLPGCLSKNILVFFALIGILNSIKHNFRAHSLILGITVSYQLILAVSAVSTSGRYQLVTLPFLCFFMAIGIEKYHPKKTNLFLLYLFAMFLVIIGWNYFKLSIRQMTL
jgi:4-amino-4-deoxy-L-arabinose transferase-like glycosyltransferase